MRRIPLLAAFVLSAFSIPFASGGSQVARGTVTERGSGAKIPGVLVSLVNEQGQTVRTVFSDQDGAYDISAPDAGRYLIEAKRIGVRQKRGALFTLAAGETHRENVVLDPIVSTLATTKIEGQSRCVARPGDNERTASLWEDARAALTATVLTSKTPITGLITRFTRDRDPGDGRILVSDHKSASGDIGNPFVSIPVELLSKEGYVVPRDDGSTDYYAPDANALLSDEFLQDHCFRFVPGGETRVRQVGLGFEPVKGRKVADIKGVLWLDAATAELQDIEFTYSEIPGLRRQRDFGGQVRFARLTDGRWIVSAWVIRMPVLAEYRRQAQALPGDLRAYANRQVVVRAVREEGGTVLVQRGDPPPRQAITGVVVDGTGSPLAGARVSVMGTSISATTGEDGRFEIPEIPEGLYSVIVGTPELDSLGVTGPADTVRLTPRGSPNVTLAVPSRARLAATMCPDAPLDEHLAALRVLVVDSATGAAQSEVPARIWWKSYTGSVQERNLKEKVDGTEATLDSLGSFTMCGLPAGHDIYVESPSGAKTIFSDTLTAAAGEIGWRVVRSRTIP